MIRTFLLSLLEQVISSLQEILLDAFQAFKIAFEVGGSLGGIVNYWADERKKESLGDRKVETSSSCNWDVDHVGALGGFFYYVIHVFGEWAAVVVTL